MTIDSHIDYLHRHGVADMHFDLLMDLYEKRHRKGVLGEDHWPALHDGNVGVLFSAIYLEDKYLPEQALRVALGQIARLRVEVDADDRFAICTTFQQIEAARAAGKVALVITMEGVEPLGNDIDMLRVFYEMGVRSIGLTHARRNMAAEGGVFAPSGSSPQGLTRFGKEIIRQCEALGILVDLAHLNPAGTDDVLAMATKPLILSHTNPRAFYNIERNSTDAHIKGVAQLGGVVGINSVLVSNVQSEATLDRFIDHIEHMIGLAGIDHVGLGLDFFEFIYNAMPAEERRRLDALATVCFVPELRDHSHTRNLTRRLIERGFADADIEKILYGNVMRVLAQILD
jgi:membrane dipeptidase